MGARARQRAGGVSVSLAPQGDHDDEPLAGLVQSNGVHFGVRARNGTAIICVESSLGGKIHFHITKVHMST